PLDARRIASRRLRRAFRPRSDLAFLLLPQMAGAARSRRPGASKRRTTQPIEPFWSVDALRISLAVHRNHISLTSQKSHPVQWLARLPLWFPQINILPTASGPNSIPCPGSVLVHGG